jgi:predicted nuclease of predicted toxin-antitoxin system
MRFLLDINLPPAMTDWLRAEGTMPSALVKLASLVLPDQRVFARAAEDGRIVVTFNLDFGEIVALRGASGARVALLPPRLVRQSRLRERLEVAIAEAAEALQAGAIVVVEDTCIRLRRMPPGD